VSAARKRAAPTAHQSVQRWYEKALRTAVEDLRPRFESGELRGWLTGDGEHGTPPPPFFVLEEEVEARICPDFTRKALVLAVSPSVMDVDAQVQAWGVDGGWAQAVAAGDALKLARRLGYAKRRRGETFPYRPERS
jgi:hypothetical protein